MKKQTKSQLSLRLLAYIFSIFFLIPCKPFRDDCIKSLFALNWFVIEALQKIKPFHFLSLVDSTYDTLYDL